MRILKLIVPRLLFIALLFALCNVFYAHFFWTEELKKNAPLALEVEAVSDSADVLYFGESSNTSFNPFTDTLTQSISGFLQSYLPVQRVRDITHSGYHSGMFLALMRLIPESSPVRTVVVTMNLRNCGPAAIHTTLEPYMQKQKVYYSKRLPLLSRLFLSMKYYDNRDSMERERLKFKAWRTEDIRYPGVKHKYHTARDWYDAVKYPDEAGVNQRKRILADDYIKAFAFVLDENNPRIADFDAMVQLAAERGYKMVFHLVPENIQYADLLLGDVLLAQIRHNRDFLLNRYQGKGVVVVDNLELALGSEFTDQFWTTEHVNARVRRACARNLAKVISGKEPDEMHLRQNNWPNPAVLQPMADTLLGLKPSR